ncbi:MAG: hypothetical protein SNF33_08255 [Candidatus Algichlamydia australiensis]|nr:hypothetical protein [Chlamydiales bacterium]
MHIQKTLFQSWRSALETETKGSQIELEKHYEEVRLRATDFLNAPLVNEALKKIAKYILEKHPVLKNLRYTTPNPEQVKYNSWNWPKASYEALGSKLPSPTCTGGDQEFKFPHLEFLKIAEEEFTSTPELTEAMQKIANFIASKIQRAIEVEKEKRKKEEPWRTNFEEELASLYE